jgi:hypothetical protein
MSTPNSSEMLLRAQVAVDQARLSRVETQTAIERSRTSLAETRALLIAIRFAARNGNVRRHPIIQWQAASEAQRLLTALTKIQNENT